jgi:hypothetical protein
MLTNSNFIITEPTYADNLMKLTQIPIQGVFVLRDRCVPKNRHVYRNRVNRDLLFFQ